MPTNTRKQLAFSKTQMALSTKLPRQKRLSLLSTTNSVKPSWTLNTRITSGKFTTHSDPHSAAIFVNRKFLAV